MKESRGWGCSVGVTGCIWLVRDYLSLVGGGSSSRELSSSSSHSPLVQTSTTGGVVGSISSGVSGTVLGEIVEA